MRLTSLRSTSIAGGVTTNPSNDMMGSCITMTTVRLIRSRRSRPIALISELRTSVMDFAPAVSRARKSEECPPEKKPDAFAHQLGKQRPLVVGEDRVADLRQDHGMA